MNEIVIHAQQQGFLNQLRSMTKHMESLNTADSKIADAAKGLESAHQALQGSVAEVRAATDILLGLATQVSILEVLLENFQVLLYAGWILLISLGLAGIGSICFVIFRR